jgi:hypothetical protein
MVHPISRADQDRWYRTFSSHAVPLWIGIRSTGVWGLTTWLVVGYLIGIAQWLCLFHRVPPTVGCL